MTLPAKLAQVLGGALLLQSGISALDLIHDTEEDEVPFSILLTLLLALALLLLGSLAAMPEFRSTRGLKQLNSMTRDEFLDRASFRRYNHGAAIYQRILQDN